MQKYLGQILFCIMLVCCQSWVADSQTTFSIASLIGKYISRESASDSYYRILEIKPDGHFSCTTWAKLNTFARTGKDVKSGKLPDSKMDARAGGASMLNGLLTLKIDSPKKGDEISTIEFVPASWGSRLYLIHKKDVLQFCNDLNLGLEPQDNSAYIRMGDEKKIVSGLPSLPGEWSRFLLKKPLAGMVLRMVTIDKAEINLGAEDGVRVGMILMAHAKSSATAKNDRVLARLTVLKTSPHSSEVKFGNPDGVEDAFSEPIKLTKGQVVSSRLKP